jgi:hypothetical protein
MNQPLAAPTPERLPEQTPGKGEVSKPNTTGPIVATGAGGSIGGGFGFGEWVSAHPFLSVMIAVAVLTVVVVAFEAIARKWRAAKQDAPTPGVIPVPDR